MTRSDVRDVVALVRSKLMSDPEAGCGLFWPDNVQTLYGIEPAYGIEPEYGIDPDED